MLIVFTNSNIKINAYSNETSNIVDYSTSDLVDEIIEKELDYITLYSTKYIGINQYKTNSAATISITIG